MWRDMQVEECRAFSAAARFFEKLQPIFASCLFRRISQAPVRACALHFGSEGAKVDPKPLLSNTHFTAPCRIRWCAEASFLNVISKLELDLRNEGSPCKS